MSSYSFCHDWYKGSLLNVDVMCQSDPQSDEWIELLSSCKLKYKKKIVCWTQEGVINVWSWGTWGDISDTFPVHTQSIGYWTQMTIQSSLVQLIAYRLFTIHPDITLRKHTWYRYWYKWTTNNRENCWVRFKYIKKKLQVASSCCFYDDGMAWIYVLLCQKFSEEIGLHL